MEKQNKQNTATATATANNATAVANTANTAKKSGSKRNTATATKRANQLPADTTADTTAREVINATAVQNAVALILSARNANKIVRAWKSGNTLNATAPTAEELRAIEEVAKLRANNYALYQLATNALKFDSKSAKVRAIARGGVNSTATETATADTLRNSARCALGNIMKKAGNAYYNTLAREGVTRSLVLDAVADIPQNVLERLRDNFGWRSEQLLNRATATAITTKRATTK